MADTMIILWYVTLSMWTIVRVNSFQATWWQQNYIMACEDNRWADNQIKKAKNKCEEYKQYACQYQTPDEENSDKARILNGDYVFNEGTLPHMAFIMMSIERIMNKNVVIHKLECTGTLISDKFVMTAAHCVMDITDYYQEILIKLGSVDRGRHTDGEWHGVDRIYKHPYYNHYEDLLHDIALVELSETVQFNAHIRPICLNTNYEIIKHISAIAAGWGYNYYDGSTYPLKMVELRINDSACDDWLSDHSPYFKVAKQFTFCAGEIENYRCGFDSSGPLQIILMNNTCPNTYELIGVPAFGYDRSPLNCSFNNGVYSKVELYVPWIASIVWTDSDDE
ncbi:serine protease 48-like [Planococcus citri]|uniref:serine protease 48-like n=1 Tax=Planococcus citri TaxID=170843 RepID=UPI0031F8E12D